MKYLIWGAGRNTQIFVDSYYSFYFRENPIIAIVDNDEDKCGKKFMDWPVINPKQIKNYCFDKILLCSHELTITEQIVNDLLIKKVKIITKKELLGKMKKELLERYVILEKRVLVVGDYKRYVQLKDSYVDLLNVVGFVEYRNLSSIMDAIQPKSS